ncbi:MAG: TolC family protein [Polyangiaceae bacterium]|nr:TolC family protein [Polyangiaceae bacterium]
MRRLVSALACAAALSWPATARAVDAVAAGPGYTLRQCLSLAEHNHPNIAVAQAKLAYYRAQVAESRSAPFSAFSLTGGAGPAPTFRGGPVYTQDREVGLSSSLGMAWRFTVDGTVPIWTFGKITNTWRAADAQAQLGEEDIKRARNAVRTDVRRAYYGLQLARDTKALLREAADRLDSALTRAKKRVKEDDGDEIDVLRLDTARADIDGRLAEAERGERVALAALRFYTGVDGAFDISDAPLRPPKHELSELARYVEVARGKRPELNMARAGVRAREAQVDLARSRRLPDLGLYLFWSYARAPEITDQTNPFVRDDINYSRYGFALGLKWNLDFLPATARVHQAEAQLQETRALLRFASSGISADVEKAFREAEEAKKKVDAYHRATRSAKQWMVKISQGIDVGVREETDLVDPARQYALYRFNYLSALMDLNMAMANLAEKTGWDDVAEPAEAE